MESTGVSIKTKLEQLAHLVEQCEYDCALKLCDEIIEEDDSVYEVYSERSYMLYQLGRKSEAFLDLQLLMELRPESPSAYLRRAVWNLELGHDLLAIQDLSLVIETEDQYFLDAAYFYRSVAYLNTGKKMQALMDCQRLPEDLSFYVRTRDDGGRLLSVDSIRNMASH